MRLIAICVVLLLVLIPYISSGGISDSLYTEKETKSKRHKRDLSKARTWRVAEQRVKPRMSGFSATASHTVHSSPPFAVLFCF